MIACFEGAESEGNPPLSVYAQGATVQQLRDYVARLGTSHKLPKASPELVDRILNVPIYRWTREGYEKAQAEYTESEHRIAKYKEMVESDKLRKALFKREVKALG